MTATEIMGREEFNRRWPAASYEDAVDTDKKIAAYYAQPQEVISAHLAAQHAEHYALGLNTD